ncbi:hypothetical protein SVIO_002080 [Streptomyces violaceusniger]|uniref:Uncharacterized protein n=1 Tax=Streptomyces violaceusniger TaxID=68280 RepID=A0A4D4KKV3_STRVO|nr:hypothetical protein SVIO_002080 [Streptomyces violaceusniger]
MAGRQPVSNDGNASEPRIGGRTARTGVWFVAARGSVAATAVAGMRGDHRRTAAADRHGHRDSAVRRHRPAAPVARNKLGMRYRLAVSSLDASPLRGSHGRLPTSDEEGPLVLVSTPPAVSGRVAATEVKSLLLRLAGLS